MGERIIMYDVSSLFLPAFISGLITFFAPCTFPLIPAYLGLISGATAEDLADPQKKKIINWDIVKNGILFIAGFSLVFIFLGAGFGLLGTVIVGFRLWITKLAGVFLVFAGLGMLGFLKFPAFNLFKVKNLNGMDPSVRAFVLGAALGAGWTPCIGPILGAVLTLASASSTWFAGAQLLAIFSLGLAVPFILVAILVGSAQKYLLKLNKYIEVIAFISGILLILFGILIFTNKLGYLMGWGFKIFKYQDVIMPLL